MSDSGSARSSVLLEDKQNDNSSEKKNTSYVPGERSGKWTELEHMKYIVFIDFNKERMRSKQKRRSNKFYQEMADFIQTRNALQCRSHHQKLQEKYAHPPKIVNIFKPIFDKGTYKQAMQDLQHKRESSSQKSMKQEALEIRCKNVETQTQIGGMNLEFITINPDYILIQPRGYHYLSPGPTPLYYNQFYAAPYHDLSSPTLPSSSMINTPTSWQNRAFSFDFGGN